MVAGRVIWQDIMKISKAIEDNELKDNRALQNHISKLKESGGTCHVMGLVSPGGVHSLQDHVAALAKEVSRCSETLHQVVIMRMKGER